MENRFTYTEKMVLQELLENIPLHRFKNWVNDDGSENLDDIESPFWDALIEKIDNLETN